MALDSNAVWGKAVADAIIAIGITAGTPITTGQLETVWAAIVGEHATQLGKADVAPGGFTNSGGPVTGTGGPVS